MKAMRRSASCNSTGCCISMKISLGGRSSNAVSSARARNGRSLPSSRWSFSGLRRSTGLSKPVWNSSRCDRKVTVFREHPFDDFLRIIFVSQCWTVDNLRGWQHAEIGIKRNLYVRLDVGVSRPEVHLLKVGVFTTNRHSSTWHRAFAERLGDQLPLIFINHVPGLICSDFFDVDTVTFEDTDHLPNAGD